MRAWDQKLNEARSSSSSYSLRSKPQCRRRKPAFKAHKPTTTLRLRSTGHRSRTPRPNLPPPARQKKQPATELRLASLPEQVSAVKVGMDAKLTFKEVPGKEFDGKISRIISTPETLGSKTLKYSAIIDFKNDEGLIRPGVTVSSVKVPIGEVKGVVAA